MQVEKALINDRLLISFIYNFAVIYPQHLLFSLKVVYCLTVSIAFSVYKQNLTAKQLRIQ